RFDSPPFEDSFEFVDIPISSIGSAHSINPYCYPFTKGADKTSGLEEFLKENEPVTFVHGANTSGKEEVQALFNRDSSENDLVEEAKVESIEKNGASSHGPSTVEKSEV
ncbi:hypothetical protein PFISCL1PPCAC_12183, partial [Pristionchus fissidentatus]